MDSDELEWRQKKTSVERDYFGSGRGGGPPIRTAIGAAGSGGDSDGTAFCKRLAVHHSDPAVVFALKIMLQPLVHDGSIEFINLSMFNLRDRCFDAAVPKFDLLIAEITEQNIGIFRANNQGKHPNKVIVIGATSLISQYLIRLFYTQIAVCPLRFGLDPVLYLVREYLRRPNRNLIFHQEIEDFYFVRQFGLLDPRQRNLLRRLSWSDSILLNEFYISEWQLAGELRELYDALKVSSREEAIDFGERIGIAQISLEPDAVERVLFDSLVLNIISNWLSAQLLSSSREKNDR
ncbi:MAG TPA: hypothetical protein V6C76_08375 [Drouetiella sp.]